MVCSKSISFVSVGTMPILYALSRNETRSREKPDEPPSWLRPRVGRALTISSIDRFRGFKTKQLSSSSSTMRRIEESKKVTIRSVNLPTSICWRGMRTSQQR